MVQGQECSGDHGMDRDRSGGGVSGVHSWTFPLPLPISLSLCLCLSGSVALRLFLCVLLARVSASPFLLVAHWLYLSFCLSFAPLSLRLLLSVNDSVSLSLLLPMSLHAWAPAYTCLHLPCREGNFAPFPPSHRLRWVSANPRCFLGTCVCCPTSPGRPCGLEVSLPGPRLRVDWVRRGIRSGEHWLHKGREQPWLGGPSFARADGRAGLCNG